MDKPKVVSIPPQQAANPSQIPQPRGVSMDRVLQEYAKLHLELNMLAEENLMLKQALQSIQQQTVKELSERDAKIQALEDEKATNSRIGAEAPFAGETDTPEDGIRLQDAQSKLPSIRRKTDS